MPKKETKDVAVEKAKKKLGEEIVKCRGENKSQRKLASAVGLSPSNMKYIEDGVNAPSPDIYSKLIIKLKPPPKQLETMDKLYTAIRKIPPPDVCDVINNNQELFEAFRLLDGQKLSKKQISQAKLLFQTFVDENKGEN